MFKAIKEEGKDTKGNKITQIDTIMFQDDVTADQIQEMTEEPDSEKIAIT